MADRLWRALGFPMCQRARRVHQDDARALELATEGLADLLSQSEDAAVELAVHEARIVSAHLAGLAETELDAIEAMTRLGFRREVVKEASSTGFEGSSLGWLIFYGIRRQLLAAIERRTILARDDTAAIELAVGFVDLAGFVPLSERLEVVEVGRLLNRFEGVAFDTVTEAGGRVVKLIGDEAMFVCPDARAAAALILETAAECGLPSARRNRGWGRPAKGG